MSWIITDEYKGQRQELVPAGKYDAVCSIIADVGHEYWPRYKKWNRKIFLGFEIPELRTEFTDQNGNEINKPRLMTRRFPLNINVGKDGGKKSDLRKFLERWKGGELERDANGNSIVDFEKLGNFPCQLEVEHVTKNGTTYANIDRVYPFQGENKPTVEGDVIFFSLDKIPKGENPIDHFPANCPPWIYDSFLNSREAQEWDNRHKEDTDWDNAQVPSQNDTDDNSTPDDTADTDDDFPF